ncbi:IS200/IS605 family accessory protein TnpB-related protein [Streptomyces sp. NBC_00038]|uniref:IS200/IS605 family accessory protein TnpB-related protein n=1 Tax=Streptomyces sp. NBC_00038 TaxID=2903615 RepID=UPI00225A0202|nr:IS200/IS605 family accessory protein TnpB-related protein [Streptomyces sp. NBC_00038]MCX5555962.1 IS200/IS605 family accessory protein TnpB-related protein [Streptomyces sp. NBC_00038]
MSGVRGNEERSVSGLRVPVAPFVAAGPSGVAVRDRLKHLTAEDEKVLRLIGAHLGMLASRDLKARCADGLEHSADTWAERKRELTPLSSSRWAGAVTKASHDQWALSRRCLAAHIHGLEAGIKAIRHRLSLPIGERGSKRAPGGYRSAREWHAKSRRLAALEARHAAAVEDWQAGRVRAVRGGKRLANTRHHLAEADLTEARWRERWEAERWFIAADGESGKRYGNETIRVTPDGEINIKLPAPLSGLANAPHGRYVLAARVTFPHRGPEWADRIEANRAVAYRIHYDATRARWYLTASWQYAPAPQIPLDAALAHGVIGVDTNADHLAAWRLDRHGNPIGSPRRFFYDLTGTADHRDAQVRHALTHLLNWAKTCGVKAIAIEDLDFTTEKTREKHGRKRRFRQLISGMPTGRLRARLTSMADATGIAVIAVDPAYTSKWGAQHWQHPTTSTTRRTSRHDAASIAIGRRAQGHPIRRRTAPPRDDRSDRRGHRTAQAPPGILGREGPRPRIPGPRTRCVPPGHGANAGDQRAQHRSGHAAEHETWQQDSLPLSL